MFPLLYGKTNKEYVVKKIKGDTDFLKICKENLILENFFIKIKEKNNDTYILNMNGKTIEMNKLDTYNIFVEVYNIFN